jgi:hypothetical protein
MKDKILINDKRLTSTMEILRNGSVQLFREKNNKDRTFINSENCDVSLEHKNREMYAKLIDGEWYWVSGCAECNGKPRDWMSYIECEEHNVCRSCGIKRKDVKEDSVWGGKHGWICNSCHKIEESGIRREAFAALDGEEPDCSYCNEIICPHCGSEINNDDIYESQDLECHICQGELSLEVDWTASYSTTVKGKRITE